MKILNKINKYRKDAVNEAAKARAVDSTVPNPLYVSFDLVRSRVLHGTRNNEYFQFRFWNKSHKQRSEFMTYHRNQKFYAKVNDPQEWLRINHKRVFNYCFNDYLKRNWIGLPQATKEEFVSFVEENSPVFIKGCQAGWGQGIRKIYKENVDSLEQLYDELIEDGGPYKVGFVVEQSIEQNEVMSAIHPQSVNTARIVTFYNEKEVKIIAAVLRCGCGDAFVDNHGAGGISAKIDTSTGIVVSHGSGQGKINIEKHPDSGIQFKGFQLPFWEEATDMVKETALKLEERKVHYVGWDIAFLKDGVCLIECNPTADTDLLQEPTQTGIRPVYDQMVRELEENTAQKRVS